MAFDFLNTPISGNSGMTWGNALQAGMTYGSRPGSSAPLIAQQMGQQGMIQPLQQPTPLKTPLDKQQGDDSSIGAIISAILKLIGI